MPFGTTTAARTGLWAATLELAHDELKKQQRGFGGLFVFGEIAEDAALFFAAERRIGQDDIDAVFVADFSQSERERLFNGSICGDSRPCRSRFICASRYGSGLASPPKMLCV